MKHFGRVQVLSTIVEVLLVATFLALPTRAAANVVILSHTGYVDSFGYYHVVGEVQNIGDQAVNVVEITATFYYSNGSAITTRFDLTMLSVLMDREKSPFELDLLDESQSANVNRYSLSVTFSATSPIPPGLEISTQNSTIDESGYMHIVGEIRNIGTGKASNVKVVATYYDKTGNVTAAASTYLDPEQPSELDPGQTKQFEISLSEERTPSVATYELTAESTQYTVVSELPILASLLLTFFMLTMVALALRKHSLSTVSAHAKKTTSPNLGGHS